MSCNNNACKDDLICNSCRHLINNKCIQERDPTTCAEAVKLNPLHWLSIMKDPFVEEGQEAFKDGCDIEDCPYDEGTDGEYGWKCGWKCGWNLSYGNEQKKN